MQLLCAFCNRYNVIELERGKQAPAKNKINGDFLKNCFNALF